MRFTGAARWHLLGDRTVNLWVQLPAGPLCCRVFDHIEMNDPTAIVAEHDQYEQHSERRRRHGQEIECDQIGDGLRGAPVCTDAKRVRPGTVSLYWRRKPYVVSVAALTGC